MKLIQQKLFFFLKTTSTLVVLASFTFILTSSQTSPTGNSIGAADNQVVLTTKLISDSFDVNNITVTKTLVEPIRPRDIRAIVLQNFLISKGSYLANHTDLIVELSDNYSIDPRIVIAMAGAESSYCKINFRPYNCWGYGRNSWSSPEESIRKYMYLMNIGYYSLGARSIETIANRYNPHPEHYTQSVYNHFNQMPNM